VGNVEEVEQGSQHGAHHQMLGRVLSLVATPRDQQEHGQLVEDVQRAERVERHPEARVLHDHGGAAAAQVGARGDAERRVFPRLSKVAAAALELGDHRTDEGAGNAGEEVEAGGEEFVDEAGGGDGSAQRATSAHARR
jgi:hypothetical protein